MLRKTVEKAEVIFGRKDGIPRRVTPVPMTQDKDYVDVQMRVNGVLVRQRVRRDRLRSIKVADYAGVLQ